METKNLIIRETVFEDCEYFAKWEVDPEVTEFLSFDEDRSYSEIVEEWIMDKQDPTKLHFTIVRKSIKEPIGRVYISRVDDHCDSLDITKLYIAGQENRKLGLGRELLQELLEYCFVFLHRERVTLDHYSGNKPAAALYEKLGFRREGTARNATKKNGRYYDLHLLSMLRAEFFEKVYEK